MTIFRLCYILGNCFIVFLFCNCFTVLYFAAAAAADHHDDDDDDAVITSGSRTWEKEIFQYTAIYAASFKVIQKG